MHWAATGGPYVRNVNGDHSVPPVEVDRDEVFSIRVAYDLVGQGRDIGPAAHGGRIAPSDFACFTNQ